MFFNIDTLQSEDGRRALAELVNADAEKGRKAESFRQLEIIADRFKQFVAAGLLGEFSQSTVNEMPIVSSINVSKKIIDETAVIYKTAPEREFSDVSKSQETTIEKIYKDGKFNQKLFRSNRNFKYQDQSTVMIIPKNGKLMMRVLKNHHYSVITDADGEDAIGYIISSYDSSSFLDNSTTQQADSSPTGFEGQYDEHDQQHKQAQRMSADTQTERMNQRLVVWTRELNFVMDGNGEIILSGLDDDLSNPLGRLPFVDIASTRDDFSFWIRQGLSLTDFSVELNQFLSSLFQVIKLQGFAQAIMSGPSDLMPQSMTVGVNHVLKLPVDEGSGVETKFDFVSPSPDIEGSLKVLESLLSMFLSTNSIDPKAVSTTGETTTYSSGLERMLAMIELLSASKEDFDTYKNAEEDIWELVKDWMNILTGTNTLDSKYETGAINPNSELFVKFITPEMVQSESEKLINIEKKIDLGISSSVEGLMDLEGISRDIAEKKIKQFQEDEGLNEPKRTEEIQRNDQLTDGDESDV